jgi:hypothetical protein
MNLKDIKERVADAIETENPPGTDYYGTELDEENVESAREQMEESLNDHANKPGTTPPAHS